MILKTLFSKLKRKIKTTKMSDSSSASTSTDATQKPKSPIAGANRPLSPSGGDEDYWPGKPTDFKWENVEMIDLTTLEAVLKAVSIKMVERCFTNTSEGTTIFFPLENGDKAYRVLGAVLMITDLKLTKDQKSLRQVVADQMWKAGAFGSPFKNAVTTKSMGQPRRSVHIGKSVAPTLKSAVAAKEYSRLAGTIRTKQAPWCDFYANIMHAFQQLCPASTKLGRQRMATISSVICAIHASGTEAFGFDDLRNIPASYKNKDSEKLKTFFLTSPAWVDCFAGGVSSAKTKIDYDTDERIPIQMESLSEALKQTDVVDKLDPYFLAGVCWAVVTEESDENEIPKESEMLDRVLKISREEVARRSRLTCLHTDYDQLKEEIRSLTEKVASVEAKHVEDLSIKDATIDGLQNGNVALQTQVTTLEGEKSVLTTQKAELETQVSNLTGEVNALKHLESKGATDRWTLKWFKRVLGFSEDKDKWGWGDIILSPVLTLVLCIGIVVNGALICAEIVLDLPLKWASTALTKGWNWCKSFFVKKEVIVL
uniref:Uncharacterized protein n=1 Tax=Rhizoctonia solani fusarivirus 4 TaxID=2870617 RepID=A0A8K1HU55_9VIRU|nr:hypothetical protein [Rhizoctonia solani fusarivirus 4]UBR58463.1 hypothetical protein [Rhizoctonia solani fusarivirus 4]